MIGLMWIVSLFVCFGCLDVGTRLSALKPSCSTMITGPPGKNQEVFHGLGRLTDGIRLLTASQR